MTWKQPNIASWWLTKWLTTTLTCYSHSATCQGLFHKDATFCWPIPRIWLLPTTTSNLLVSDILLQYSCVLLWIIGGQRDLQRCELIDFLRRVMSFALNLVQVCRLYWIIAWAGFATYWNFERIRCLIYDVAPCTLMKSQRSKRFPSPLQDIFHCNKAYQAAGAPGSIRSLIKWPCMWFIGGFGVRLLSRQL